jgi:5-formyltetrahydrofolate cyclo-ligase
VNSLPSYQQAEVIGIYAALPGEVETAGLLRELWARRKLVVLPRLEAGGLRLCAFRKGEPLRTGRLGLREPGPDSAAVAADRVDLFVVPGLYFDRAGGRLGRGRGYYDRLLASARRDAVRLGLCFSERLIPEVPVGPLDQPMDYVITERETIRGELRAAPVSCP